MQQPQPSQFCSFDRSAVEIRHIHAMAPVDVPYLAFAAFAGIAAGLIKCTSRQWDHSYGVVCVIRIPKLPVFVVGKALLVLV